MNLLEYQTRELFNQFSIPTMKACVVEDLETMGTQLRQADLYFPLVAKVQIPVGKRGKAGGVRFASNMGELEAHVRDLLHKNILSYQVNQIMLAEQAVYETELYLSILLDRESKMPMLIFSAVGGMEIEETAKINPEKIVRLLVDPLLGLSDYHVRYLLSVSGLDPSLFDVTHCLVDRLYRLFLDYDCLLCEINPLILTADKKMIAIDGKIQIDDSALYRLPDMLAIRDKEQENSFVREARACGFLYIPVDDTGRIAVMSNGSGMLMSCIDLISREGYPVAAALDLGGGSTAAKIKEALRILLATEGVSAVLINIFGGITRCDEVAKGIELAWMEADMSQKIVVRMEGTNKQEGLGILGQMEGNIHTAADLREALHCLLEGMEKQ